MCKDGAPYSAILDGTGKTFVGGCAEANYKERSFPLQKEIISVYNIVLKHPWISILDRRLSLFLSNPVLDRVKKLKNKMKQTK